MMKVPQAQDLPGATSSTMWDRFVFKVSGFFVCMWQGKLDRYSYLIAQAYQENGTTLDGRSFVKNNNPWCMWGPTDLSSGESPVGGEPVAQYNDALGWLGWLSGPMFHFWTFGYWSGYGRAWRDRLSWDIRKGVQDQSTKSQRDYAQAVVNAGWFGSNATQEQNAAYVNSWSAVYQQHAPAFAKVFDDESSWGAGLRIVLTIIIVGVVLLVILWMYRTVRKLLGFRNPFKKKRK